MSHASISVTQVTELVDNTGYPVMFESYEARPVLYPLLGEIIDPASLESPYYGTKGSVLQGMEQFKDREDGADFEASDFKPAYTWYLKCRQKGRSLTIPSRLLMSADNLKKVESLIAAAARSWGEVARLQKDDYVADIFQQGTLTAGNAAFFDGSFPGNDDPNPKFIYDGLPFFDTAHTLGGSSATKANHVVSAALTSAALQTALIAMTNTNAVNDRGERVLIRPTHLMVPSALEYTARAILQSAQLPGSANNDVNVVQNALELLVNPALDDAASASAWWLVTRGRSLKIADSGAPRLTISQERNGDVTINAEYHFGAAVDDWRYSYCANKAAS